jgi:hypothetical protein
MVNGDNAADIFKTLGAVRDQISLRLMEDLPAEGLG